MIDVESEKMIPVSMAGNHLPGHPCASTIRRWIDGYRGCQLDVLRVGGRLFTSVEACHRFIVALNEQQPESK